ncbi:Retrovirus-related Pol polyprotein from transposon RE2 [Glycine soja]|uniref:Retrovirus-related Pol polyprotein from transposon RE2 n=1 Tax=Glycine soja TaxID=3848 RepID=A0A445KDW4_GLYSO|nr:Retrovirus-related Pol polyprotein from transposon RE2 [Glycine soja]
MAYILLYVDDIILTASSVALRKSIMLLLNSKFAMKDLGPLSYFLGIAITQHVGSLLLSQKKYANKIIEHACMSSCKPCPTPVDTKPKLSAKTSTPYEDPTHYRSPVKALQYLTFTRPGISYVVQQICLFMHNPMDDHMHALRRILHYAQGTLHFGLHLYPASTTSLISYTNADWGGCPNTRKSTSGYCVFLGDNLLSWSSKRQPILSCSSAEVEYRGVANVVSESCWLRNLLLELHCPVHTVTLVYYDNVSVIYLFENPFQHHRTKHIEMDIHFVREKVSRGQVRILHVPSRYQIADIFTKKDFFGVISRFQGQSLHTTTSCFNCQGNICFLIFSLVSQLYSWVFFFIAEVCLLAGSVRNAYHTKYRTMFTEIPLSCQTVRKGIFAAGATFVLFNGIVSEFYYIRFSKARDSFQPCGGETGIGMGTYK